MKWAKVIDQRRCIGCHACTIACKSENEIPSGVTRTFVKQVESGNFPAVERHFQVTRCNQCNNPPCVEACPTSAMYQRTDGIVDFNRSMCIGCKGCIAACPYDAIYIDPETHSAEKCNFCTHRIDVGLEPACVVVCPTQAISIGDMTDPNSKVSQLIATEKSQVRRPEKGTHPKLFYVEGSEVALNPLGATIGKSYMWANRQNPPSQSRSLPEVMGWPGMIKSQSAYPSQSAAAAVVAYGNDTKPPWDWRVSSYTWTKSIAAGTFLIGALGGILETLVTNGLGLATGLISMLFLGLTGLFLISDLSHPKRFYLIMLRPQWRSWLARGAYIISGFGLLLTVFLFAVLMDMDTLLKISWWAGLIPAIMVATYTGFLLAQAKGRDLWQNPVLPIHFLIQATLAGAASILMLNLIFSLSVDEVLWLRWVLGLSLCAHILFVSSELFMPHATEQSSRSAKNMTKGKLGLCFWGGFALSLIAIGLTMLSSGFFPWLFVAAIISLTSLWLHEHAYIQAGQSVPLS